MSASEKLERLYARATATPVVVQGKVVPDAFGASLQALAALPEIIAVVKAAEFVDGYHKAHGDESRQAAWLSDLRDALNALDEKLP